MCILWKHDHYWTCNHTFHRVQSYCYLQLGELCPNAIIAGTTHFGHRGLTWLGLRCFRCNMRKNERWHNDNGVPGDFRNEGWQPRMNKSLMEIPRDGTLDSARLITGLGYDRVHGVAVPLPVRDFPAGARRSNKRSGRMDQRGLLDQQNGRVQQIEEIEGEQQDQPNQEHENDELRARSLIPPQDESNETVQGRPSESLQILASQSQPTLQENSSEGSQQTQIDPRQGRPDREWQEWENWQIWSGTQPHQEHRRWLDKGENSNSTAANVVPVSNGGRAQTPSVEDAVDEDAADEDAADEDAVEAFFNADPFAHMTNEV